jgi:hypothetical protein
MFSNPYLGQQSASIAPLALNPCLPMRACSPQEAAPALRTVNRSRFTNHGSLPTNQTFLIGCAAIKNRRNAMKTNGGLSF